MKISRHSLIFGLSYALDIAGKNNLSHSKSTAYIAVMIGRKLGLGKKTVINLFYAALLHDIAMSTTYEVLQHCIDGYEMLLKLPLDPEIADMIHYHHERMDGSGVFKLKGDNIPLDVQIISFSSAFDDMFGGCSDAFTYGLYQSVNDWLVSVERFYSNTVLNAFRDFIKQEAFLLDYFNQDTKFKMIETMKIDDEVYYDYEDVVKFALAFAEIIDKKSPFTYTHSLGIAEKARNFTLFLGYDISKANTMYVAGLLHDIGKLDVSSKILHKPDKLSTEERFEINKHTYYTRKILEQIKGFEDIVEYAANHHERIDGTGYPYRYPGEHLSVFDRIMAICDVYQALTEERPYRDNLSIERVWGIIDNMAERGHLDKELVEKAKEAFA
ncbi:MAG: HD domain-containing protein [Oscillospiraceae bacterium]|jgi:putative nucleotidyltransferase with HDIG domain|nr:HD domain-containing protein [Oscillospiraceae bacterium]